MKIYKQVRISAAHQLELPYDSPCNNLHGHNYLIEVWVEGNVLDFILVDFNFISSAIKCFDHKNLNDVIKPSTAERFAGYLWQMFKSTHQDKKWTVRVWETSDCFAEMGEET